MSAFDDMIGAGFSEAADVIGTDEFFMEGKAYKGILNEFEGEQEIELDGVLGTYNATLLCEKPQFRLLTKPLQKTLNNKLITIESIGYKVSKVVVDSASVTLGLRIAR